MQRLLLGKSESTSFDGILVSAMCFREFASSAATFLLLQPPQILEVIAQELGRVT